MDFPPRIAFVTADGATRLAILWRDGGCLTVDRAGWLARPDPVLESSTDPAAFARATVGAHGGMVTWDDGEGDLAIDALHLQFIAEEQARFAAAEAAAWQ